MLDNTFSWVTGFFGKDTETSPLPYSATSSPTADAANQIPRALTSSNTEEDEWVFLDASGQIIASASNPEPPSDVAGKVSTVRKMTRKERKEAFRIKHQKSDEPEDRGREILAALKDRELKASKFRKMACR